jgi:D-cysteine desulfhydrase
VDGNLLLDSLVGSHVHLIPRVPYVTGILPRMQALAAHLASTRGRRPYIIPVGGSDSVGLWGYLQCFDELLNQGLAENFDELAVTVGSGGTLSGLAIGNYLAGSPVRVTAFAVCDSAEYFHAHVNEMLTALGLAGRTRSEDIVTIIDRFKGRGYALSTPEELSFIEAVAASTGILLDPVYTGKAAFGLSHHLEAGRRTLFLHSGGTLGVFGGSLASHHRAGRAAANITSLDEAIFPEKT